MPTRQQKQRKTRQKKKYTETKGNEKSITSRKRKHFFVSSKKLKQAHLVCRNSSRVPHESEGSGSTSVHKVGKSPAGSKSNLQVSKDEKKKGIRTRLSTGTLFMTGTSTSSTPLSEKMANSTVSEASTSSSSTPKAASILKTSPSDDKISLKRKMDKEDELLPSLPPKKKKIGRNDGSGEDNKNDYFCWLCHKEGRLVCCELCPRVFHTKCLNSSQNMEQDWVCPECEKIMQAECTDTRSEAMAMISVDTLCRLLHYALDRMKAVGTTTFEKPVNPLVFLNYSDYVFHPMCLSQLERNIRRKMYGSTEAFLADAKWIIHNSIVYNGAQSEITSAAKSLLKVCKHELNEIEVCPDCYLNSCVQSHEDWFCEPCPKPHPIVWAKLKGYPFWPAKVLREVNGQVDVRFFGAHDRSWVSTLACFMWSGESPNTVKKSRSGMDQALKEVKVHIQKLRDKFGNFQYAVHRTSYGEANILKQLNPKAPKPTQPKIARTEQASGEHESTKQLPVAHQSTSQKPKVYMMSSPPVACSLPGKARVTTQNSASTSVVNTPVVKVVKNSVATPVTSGTSQPGRQVIYLKPMPKGVFLLSQPSEKQLPGLKPTQSALSKPPKPDLQLLERIETKINSQMSHVSFLPSSSSSSQASTPSLSASKSVVNTKAYPSPSGAKIDSRTSQIVRHSDEGNTSTNIVYSETENRYTSIQSGPSHVSNRFKTDMALPKTGPSQIVCQSQKGSTAEGTCNEIPSKVATTSSQLTTTPSVVRATQPIPSPKVTISVLPPSSKNKEISSKLIPTSLLQKQKDLNAEAASEKMCSESVVQEASSSKTNLKSKLIEAEDTLVGDSGDVSRSYQKDSSEKQSVSVDHKHSKLVAGEKASASNEEKKMSTKASASNEENSESTSSLVSADANMTDPEKKKSDQILDVHASLTSTKESHLGVEIDSQTGPPSTADGGGQSPGSMYKSSLQKVIDSCKAKLGIEDEDSINLEKEGDEDLLGDSDSDDLNLYIDDDERDESGTSDKLKDAGQVVQNPTSSQSSDTTRPDLSMKEKSLETDKQCVSASSHLNSRLFGSDVEFEGHDTTDLSNPGDKLGNYSKAYNNLDTPVSESQFENFLEDNAKTLEKSQAPQSIGLKTSKPPENSSSKESHKDKEMSHSDESSQGKKADCAPSTSFNMPNSSGSSDSPHFGKHLHSNTQSKQSSIQEISTISKIQPEKTSPADSTFSKIVPDGISVEKPKTVLGLEECSESHLGTKEASSLQDERENLPKTQIQLSTSSASQSQIASCHSALENVSQSQPVKGKEPVSDTKNQTKGDDDIELDMEVVCEEAESGHEDSMDDELYDDDRDEDNDNRARSVGVPLPVLSELTRLMYKGASTAPAVNTVTSVTSSPSVQTAIPTSQPAPPLTKTSRAHEILPPPYPSKRGGNDPPVVSGSSVAENATGLWSCDHLSSSFSSSSVSQAATMVHGSSSSSSSSLKDHDTVISLDDDVEYERSTSEKRSNDGVEVASDDDGSDVIMQDNGLCIDLDVAADDESEGLDRLSSAPKSSQLPVSSESIMGASQEDADSQLEKNLGSLFHDKTSKITAWLSDQLTELKTNLEDIVSKQKKSSSAAAMWQTTTNNSQLVGMLKIENKILQKKIADWTTSYDRTTGELKEAYEQQREREIAVCKEQAKGHLRSQLQKIKKGLEEEHALKLKNAVAEIKKRQWCAECWKEAVYYCCWNTSYCSYQCQQKHWPSHLPTCMQAQQQTASDEPHVTGTSGNRISLAKNITIIKPSGNVPANGRIVKTPQSKVSVIPSAQWHTTRDEGKRTMSTLPLTSLTLNQVSSSSTAPKTSVNAIHSAANIVGSNLQIFPNASNLQASSSTSLTFSPAQPIQPVQIQYLTQPSASQQPLQLMGGANPNIPVIMPSIMAGSPNIPTNVQLLQNPSVFPMVQQQQAPQVAAQQAQQPISGSYILQNAFGGMIRPSRPL